MDFRIIITLSCLILISFFIIVLFYLKPINVFMKKTPELFSFVVTLFATFIGVFFALELSNINERNKEVSNIVDLLFAVEYNMSQTSSNLLIVSNMIGEEEYDTSSAISIFLIAKHEHDLIDIIFKNELVLGNISSKTLGLLLVYHSHIKKYYDMFENSKDFKFKIAALQVIAKTYDLISSILFNERLHIQEIVNKEYFDDTLDSCIFSYREKLDSIISTFKVPEFGQPY